MTIQEKCRILSHKKVAPKHYHLILSSAYISSNSQPGQFVNVRCSEEFDPLLRRPLGVHAVSPKHKTFELLYEVVGKGTELLSNYSVGQEIDILGPLGTGFELKKDKKIAILVAGGMGIAPLLALASKLHMSNDKLQINILIGAKTKDLVLCEKECKALTDQVIVATDDGSYGKKGLVPDVLLDILENKLETHNLDTTTIYSCGPKAMLKAVSEIAFQKKIDCQVSMEAYMACGIGTCLGCVTKTKSGLKRVCKEGPVFDSKEIIW